METLELSAKGQLAVSDPVAGLLAVSAELTVTVTLVEQVVAAPAVVGVVEPAAPASPGSAMRRPDTPSISTTTALPIRLPTIASFFRNLGSARRRARVRVD